MSDWSVKVMTIDEWIDPFKTIDNFDVVDVNECAELINYLEELKHRRECKSNDY